MFITFVCPKCGKHVAVLETRVGQRAPCPHCHVELLLSRARVEPRVDRPLEVMALHSGREAPLSHGEKVAYYVADMSRRGVSRFVVAPPIFQLLWKLGLKVPPPHFLPFALNALAMGIGFAIGWGTFMWFFLWRSQRASLFVAIGASLLAGLFFGPLMAWGFARKAKEWRLPPWNQYPGGDHALSANERDTAQSDEFT
jgi:hypothetical protein